jgi:hypothetical protein
VIEGRGLPSCSVVTSFATLREACGHVIGIVCLLKILQVARRTGRVGAGQIEIAVDVTLCAGNGGVSACQRKPGRGMIEMYVHPIVHSVTALARG